VKISENSPQRLVLKDRSLWIAFLVIFGLMFLRSSDVVFDKAAGLCTVRELKVIRIKRMIIRFSDIEDVLVDIEPLNTSMVENCRLSLMTASAIIPLTDVYQPDLKRYNAMRDVILEALSRPASANPQPDQCGSWCSKGASWMRWLSCTDTMAWISPPLMSA
jgi:hypothetical protein